MKNKLQLTMLVRCSNTKQTKSSMRKGDVDDKMHDSKEAGGRGGDQHCRFKSCLYKTVYGEICDGHSNHDVSLRVKLNDDAIDDGKAADACGHNNASRKHPLLLGDADDTEQKKRRKRGQQKFIIDLTDVPAQTPIINNGWGGSKYEGVTLKKSTSKWKAQIKVDGKSRYIGTYANEEDAAIDHARAMFKYNRKKKPFPPLGPLPDPKEMEKS